MVSRSADLDQNIFTLDSELNNRLAKNQRVHYVSVLNDLCNADGCLMTRGADRRDDITSWDDSHLTPATSEYIVRKNLLRIFREMEQKKQEFNAASVSQAPRS